METTNAQGISPAEAIARLRRAADRLESGEYNPAIVLQEIEPAYALVYEQLLPPCTCGRWRELEHSRYWYCSRHRVGEGHINGPPIVVYWST